MSAPSEGVERLLKRDLADALARGDAVKARAARALLDKLAGRDAGKESRKEE